MSDSFTGRDEAPFDPKVWDVIDAVVRRTAAEAGLGRRVLRVEGPLGIAARVGMDEDLPVGDEEPGPVGGQRPGLPHVHLPVTRPLPLLHQPFRLGLRAIEAFSQRGEPLDTRAIAEAARTLLTAEDHLLFEGSAAAGVLGVLGQPGALEVDPGDWSEPARAADDILAALQRLDEADRHGPFLIALSPDRFYALVRPYPGTALTPYAQLLPLFEGGIVKAPTMKDAAVIIVRDESGPRVLVGQDLTALYDGREGIYHRFSLVGSATLLPGTAASVAVLRGARIETRPAATH
jgi:uncharacterized linocin/CFP29 family protein